MSSVSVKTKKFFEFSNQLISYFYRNVNTPYVVQKGSLPSVRDKVSSRTSKLSSKNSAKRDNKKNFFYKSKNGTVYLDENTKSNNEGELLSDNHSSCYLGRHIIRNGDRNQSFRRSPDPMIEFYHLYKDLFDEFEVDVDNAIVSDGCFKTNKLTLQRTMIPEDDTTYSHLASLKVIKEFKESIIGTIRKLRIPTLAKSTIDDLKYSSFSSKTYPGFFYYEYLNKKTKEEAAVDALQVAVEKWKYIDKCSKEKKNLERSKLYSGTYAVGARNKRNYSTDVIDELTSRTVHMPEFHNEIHMASWIDPISEYIRDSKRGPIYIGNSLTEYQRLYRDMGKCEDIIEGDVTRFDSRVYLNFIIIAVSISRLYYDLNDKDIDNHFIALFDTIAIKDYYTPGGFMYRLIHGLPSGVKSTSLYGSIINLVLQLHFNRNIKSKDINCCVGGDDFLIGFKNKIPSNQIEEINKNAAEVGWELKYLDKKSFASKNINEKPYFYKYTIDNNEPIISTTTLLERAFIPWNNKYKNFSEVYNFLLDLIPSLGAPRSHFLIFYHLCAHVRSRYFGTKYDHMYFYNLHSQIYKKVIEGKKVTFNRETIPRVNCSIIYDRQGSEDKFVHKRLQKIRYKLTACIKT